VYTLKYRKRKLVGGINSELIIWFALMWTQKEIILKYVGLKRNIRLFWKLFLGNFFKLQNEAKSFRLQFSSWYSVWTISSKGIQFRFPRSCHNFNHDAARIPYYSFDSHSKLQSKIDELSPTKHCAKIEKGLSFTLYFSYRKIDTMKVRGEINENKSTKFSRSHPVFFLHTPKGTESQFTLKLNLSLKWRWE
jgi:hypothetical protein